MFSNLASALSRSNASFISPFFKSVRTLATMKHVGLNGFGDPSVLKIDESPIPQPNQDQVLIRVKSAGLNRADVLQRQGKYPPPKGASNILGLEAAGYLCNSDGSVNTSKKVMTLLAGGGQAQYCLTHKNHVIEVPENISLEQAGGLPEVWITAFLLLELGQIKPNDKVLIYAGASGVGTAAIQLVRLFGGIPIVTCSTEEKVKFTKNLGAEFAINYKATDNLSKSILDVTGNKGVDIILDCVGPQYYSINTEVAAMDARWILYGLLSGAKTTANFAPLVGKRISLIATTLRSRSDDYKSDLIQRFKDKVLPHFNDGKLKVCIDSTLPVNWKNAEPIQEGHKIMERNANSGKIIYSFE